MKLHIKNYQEERRNIVGIKKGIFFVSYFKLEITDKEKDLIDKYSVEKQVLIVLEQDDKDYTPFEIRVKDLIKGVEFCVADVWLAKDYAEEIETVCKDFNNMLKEMESYGGNSVLKI